ncbi:FAD-binding oxidoreductase [Clostridium sp. 19966]|uniref:FAD-binding oxidoreductase n=1 Tax=Clostridium sp. 19966 TaxID=2768166 RepID=UPI0028DF4ADD|nr:FAD-binding oxidoreductase [Clostridium sp. 19966]MDT8717944.1 FAD-binding oxidoreductase [Clostridium sp. 19966]
MRIDDLYNIVGDASRVKLQADVEEKYLSDGLMRVKGFADAVVFPISTEEISNLMKFAYDNNIYITPRGAGTGMVGATVPVNGGIVLDLSLMNNILELDENTLTVTVEPGVLLKELQSYVEERGLFYPPDPGEKFASIGGNISTNAGGMRAVKYGVTRDYVLGLKVVLANGDILNLGGKIRKNSSGLDIKDLVIGSEGTLAVVTKAILKLVPKPKKSISVLVPFDTLKKGIEAVIKVIKSNANATAIEFVERDVIANAENYLKIEFPTHKGEAYILLTFDGDEESEIKNNYLKVKKVAFENGALDFILLDSKELIENTWKIRGALVTAVEAVSEQEPIDIVVPIDKSEEFINFTKEAEKEYGIKMTSFGHAGDGNIHLCVIRNGMEEELWHYKSDILLKALYEKSKELNGLPSGEHGIGLTKKPYFEAVTDKTNLEYMKKIKKALDEKGILNPGKVYM